MAQKPTTVIFDIGNVFVKWDPRFLYEKHISDPEQLDYFLNEVVTLSWHTEHDRGVSFDDGIKGLITKFPQYEDLIKLYKTNWFETIAGEITGSKDLLLKVAERFPVYALTNFSAEVWPEFMRRYDFTDVFLGVVVSGEERLVKPDPRIYNVAIERYKLDPARTLYIDDRQENIEAAEQLDMTGHLFTDVKNLELELRALDLID